QKEEAMTDRKAKDAIEPDQRLPRLPLVWDDETTYDEAADLADKIIAAGWRPVPAAGRSEAEIKAAVLAAFVEYGDEAGHGIHSWCCAYPGRYGPCDCREQCAAYVAGRVAGGVPGRNEADIEAEPAWAEISTDRERPTLARVTFDGCPDGIVSRWWRVGDR